MSKRTNKSTTAAPTATVALAEEQLARVAGGLLPAVQAVREAPARSIGHSQPMDSLS